MCICSPSQQPIFKSKIAPANAENNIHRKNKINPNDNKTPGITSKQSKVRFCENDSVTIRPIMSSEERKAAWLSKDEMKKIREEINEISLDTRAIDNCDYSIACLNNAYDDAGDRACALSWKVGKSGSSSPDVQTTNKVSNGFS